MKYQIIMYDNARYMEDEGRTVGPVFDDAEDALAYARSIVDEDLQTLKQEGMSAEELFTQYTVFGADPQIVSVGEEVFFSAWEYARQRCKEILNSRVQ